MEFVSKDIIKIRRELSELDRFALDFIKVIKKQIDYVLVSGYVSILLGRARASEDIDLVVSPIGFETFTKVVDEIYEKGFYCLNADDKKEMYDYLTKEKVAIRFARKDTAIPNMEFKFAKNEIDDTALKDKIKVIVDEEEISVSNLELQVAFKEDVLRSPKYLEDARHIRNIAKDNLDKALIERYKVKIDEILG